MKNAFFTTNLIIVTLGLGIVGLVVFPLRLTHDQVREEVPIVKILEKLGAAQYAFRLTGTAGRYGTLDELLAPAPDGRSWLNATLTGAGGMSVRIGGYRLAVFLPDAAGHPVPTQGASDFDTGVAAEAFMAVAWPVDVRKAPYRAYAVNQWLVVHEHVNGAGELAGETIPTTSFEELAAIDSVTGEATATEFQDPWRSIVRRAQIKRLAKRLERWQLSTPAWLMKKK